MSPDQKLKMKEIGEVVANLLWLDKQIGISQRGLTLSTFGMNVREVLKTSLDNSRLNLGI